MRVIAEAGVNFRNLDEAKEMIKKAHKIGCWAIKFQLYNNEIIKRSKDYYFLKSIMLDYNKTLELFEYGSHKVPTKGLEGFPVFFSCMFPEAVDWCERIGVNYYKIRHKDRNNKELCKKIIETNKPYFISRNSFDDLTEFVRNKGVLSIYQKKDSLKANILWCEPYYPAPRTYYPTPNTYGFIENFRGYSDHTKGLEMLIDFKYMYNTNEFYWEKHVMLEGTEPLEKAWSCTFQELAEVLKDG